MTTRDFRDVGVLLLVAAAGAASLAGGWTGFLATLGVTGAVILLARATS